MAKNWAICIGINYYENLTDLRFAMRDAESMKDWFENEANFEKVYLFTDNSPPITDASQSFPSQPSYGRLIRFLESRFNHKFLSIEDNLWFFFSGHGTRYGDRDYLMLSDSSVIGDLIEKTGIAFNYVTERLKRSGAGNVIFITDACRNEGASKGLGVGEERYQGVISIASCSPSERSFEIEEKQQGSFTYALLESLRITGSGNCAVVERLDQRLRQRVPELTRQYTKQQQTPYIIAEPIAKTNLILLPSQATLKDVSALRDEAYRAENNQDLELATIFMTQILIASPADPDALAWFKRTWLEELKYKHKAEIRELEKSHQGKIQELEQSFQSTIKQLEQGFAEERSQVAKRIEDQERLQRHQVQEIKVASQKEKEKLEQNYQKQKQKSEQELSLIIKHFRQEQERSKKLEEKQQSFQGKIKDLEQQLGERRSQLEWKIEEYKTQISQLEQELGQERSHITSQTRQIERLQRQKQTLIRAVPINRRKFLKWTGLGGASLVTAFAAHRIFKNPFSVAKPKQIPTTDETSKIFEFPLLTVEFETLSVDSKGEIINRQNNQAKFFNEYLGRNINLEMVYIPGGKFMMGSREDDGEYREKPQHEVTVKPFFMGKFEITQAQWKVISFLPEINGDIAPNPSRFRDNNLPVEGVEWYEAIEFCRRLSKLKEKESRLYRLPSEAEWEYACRAGTNTPFNFGETITTRLANYNGNHNYATENKGKYRGHATHVETFAPNAFGLYDMHGNVQEWCQDDWHENYEGAPKDGSVWNSESGNKVIRGGSFDSLPSDCRSASRTYRRGSYYSGIIGFRVVCVIKSN